MKIISLPQLRARLPNTIMILNHLLLHRHITPLHKPTTRLLSLAGTPTPLEPLLADLRNTGDTLGLYMRGYPPIPRMHMLISTGWHFYSFQTFNLLRFVVRNRSLLCGGIVLYNRHVLLLKVMSHLHIGRLSANVSLLRNHGLELTSSRSRISCSRQLTIEPIQRH